MPAVQKYKFYTGKKEKQKSRKPMKIKEFYTVSTEFSTGRLKTFSKTLHLSIFGKQALKTRFFSHAAPKIGKKNEKSFHQDKNCAIRLFGKTSIEKRPCPKCRKQQKRQGAKRHPTLFIYCFFICLRNSSTAKQSTARA